MLPTQVILIGLCNQLAMISSGGGLYEHIVVDAAWARRPDIIQPSRGGISRAKFWIPAHTIFEVMMIITLISIHYYPPLSNTNNTDSININANSNDYYNIKWWLYVSFVSHIIMRVWSFIDFIPRAIAFERADTNDIKYNDAMSWITRSRYRMPLSFVTCISLMMALIIASNYYNTSYTTPSLD
jgi:hypothetical protein